MRSELLKEIRERAWAKAKHDPEKRSFDYWYDKLINDPIEVADIEDDVLEMHYSAPRALKTRGRK